MKGLKFSALLGAIFPWKSSAIATPLIGSLALSLSMTTLSTAAAAQTDTPQQSTLQTATDSVYIDQLYSFLQGVDATTYAMATQSMSEEDSIWAAQMFCRTFDSGVSPTDAFLVYTNSAIEQATALGANMTEEMAYAVGLYGGAVMNLGSTHYCPQHQAQVEQALASFR